MNVRTDSASWVERPEEFPVRREDVPNVEIDREGYIQNSYQVAILKSNYQMGSPTYAPFDAFEKPGQFRLPSSRLGQ